MVPLTEPEIQKFAEQIGRMLLRLPIVSASVGHKWAKGTVQDYFRPMSPEADFLIDLFSRPIPEVLVKWYPQQGPLFSHPDCNVKGAPSEEEVEAARRILAHK